VTLRVDCRVGLGTVLISPSNSMVECNRKFERTA